MNTGFTGQKRQLVNASQRDFPLVPRPFAEIGNRLGISEDAVLELVQSMKDSDELVRVGATIRPNTIGASTLAAMAVDESRLAEVADIVSSFSEVNHNYRREHRFNLWFVVIADSEQSVQDVLDNIREKTGIDVLNLPLEQPFHIDLGFDL